MFKKVKQFIGRYKVVIIAVTSFLLVIAVLCSCQGLLNVNGKDNYITLGESNTVEPTINNGNDNTIIKK